MVMSLKIYKITRMKIEPITNCLRGPSIILVVDEKTSRYLTASNIRPVYLSQS